jgi:hypothetical protein
MPYMSSGQATPATHPLMPEDQKPEACRRLGCTMEIFREGVMKDERGEITFDLLKQDTVAWAHTLDGRTNTYLIPMAWLDDVDKDIWGEIRSWMESLHEQGERPGQERETPDRD